jgi:hypothetical protein
MSIEEIKAEIAKLEPQEREAWKKLKAAQATLQPVTDEWYALNQRIGNLKAAASILG